MIRMIRGLSAMTVVPMPVLYRVSVRGIVTFRYSLSSVRILLLLCNLFPTLIMSSSSSSSSDTLSPTSASSPSDVLSAHISPIPHPYLSPGQASTIAMWTSSLPDRGAQSQRFLSENESASREAAIEAYRQLKLTLFSRPTGSTKQRNT